MSENVFDSHRGQTAEDFKKQVESKQQGGQQKQEAQTQQPPQQQEQPQNQTSSDSSNTETQQTKQPSKDADSVDQKDINTLANTFGVDYESLPESSQEGFLRMAKSYREAQGKYTSVAQQAKQAEESLKTLENFNQFLSKNDDIKRQIENRLSGNQQNQSGEDTPSKPKPNNSLNGQSATVELNQLKSEGYISDEDLQGLDELAKQRKVAQAELAYLRDQELSNFREGLKKEKEKLTQAERAEKVKQINTERINDGVDRVVSDYGIDFTSLDNETIEAIQKRAFRILDPADPNGQTIDKDAMYDATLKELSLRGKLPQQSNQQNGQPKTLNSITDTGRQLNKQAGQVSKPNTREDIYQKRMAEKRATIKDTAGIFAGN